MTTLRFAPSPPRSRRSAVRPLGPAFVAAIAYVDPGNLVTNVTAGAQFGTGLLWVVVLATLVAGPVQYLAAKLGATTGLTLPQLVGRNCSTPWRVAYWVQAEIVSIATDVAEVIGAAFALYLLFGVPMPVGGVIAAVVGGVLLAAGDRLGERFLQGVAVAALGVIGAAFVFCLAYRPPALHELGSGMVPGLPGDGALYLAAGIVGATIMPHAVHIHSALARTHGRLKAHRVDVFMAMLFAGTVNASMLVVGAGALFGLGADDFAGIAHGLSDRVGGAAQTAFLVALLTSGLSSTAVGTQSGEVVMSGLMRRRIPRSLRRLITVLPAVALLTAGISPVGALIASQVILAIGLPFVLVPLGLLTSSRRVMGDHANRLPVKIGIGVVVAAVTVLDVALLMEQFFP
ncbi:Nramp family divalent metal transporter [Streptomyces althioticus]|uniref:Nramp family divalent metal transporter n=1 Tax=Streptomyces althioticus TaxID=83380 RepID=UPI0037A5895E